MHTRAPLIQTPSSLRTFWKRNSVRRVACGAVRRARQSVPSRWSTHMYPMCIWESFESSWSEEQGLMVGGILLVAHMFYFLSFLSMRSAFVPSLNLTVPRFRAVVIGKRKKMYEELFQCFFSVAAANGMAAPRAAGGADGMARPRRVPFVSTTMDLEMAKQPLGLLKAMARGFGGQSIDNRARAIGCGVQFKRFLLTACENNQQDPFSQGWCTCETRTWSVTWPTCGRSCRPRRASKSAKERPRQPTSSAGC